MTHGSLFSGIGGFDLAAEWMGWENKFHCEWNPFGQKVLKHYWPEAESFNDITKTNFTKYAGTIDIISGGFPCQPYSTAGKRLGKADERHLFPEMLRAIREIRPRWVVGENVRGLVSWSGGLVFEEVQADLESEGYEVQPFLIPAAGVNAPHQRYRIWFIAYSTGNGFWNCTKTGEIRRKEIDAKTERGKSSLFFKANDNGYKSNWKNFPTVSPICNGDDGLSSRLDGITFPKWRAESIKAGGNAIVPQVALQIFKAIQEYENMRILQ